MRCSSVPEARGRVYGRNTSVNTQRVLFALHELDVDYELINASATLGASGRRTPTDVPYGLPPEVCSNSPFKQIPVYVDPSGLALRESCTIVKFLFWKHSDDLSVESLLKASEWHDYFLSTFGAGTALYHEGDFMGSLINLVVRKPGDVPERVLHYAKRASAQLKLLNEHFEVSKTAYLMGSNFSVADVPLVCDLFRLYAMFASCGQSNAPGVFKELLLKDNVALREYLDRVASRHGFIKGCAEPELEHQARSPELLFEALPKFSKAWTNA